MTNAQPTILYIPDISGFTEFVSETEIGHSRHIISELLKIIIDSNELNMKVSEIEGDAVFFYLDEPLAAVDILKQCKTTFINFHNHLQHYEKERVCRCGACETAVNLSLKFIIHQGAVEKIQIGNHHKLHGKDVIVAHKLLKNSIPLHEYILLSNQFILANGSSIHQSDDFPQLEKATENFEQLYELNYSFFPLSELLSQIQTPPDISFPPLGTNTIHLEMTINAPIGLLYDNFTNLEKRAEWNEDIKEIIKQGNGLDKSGSTHTCLVGPYSLNIESLGRLETKDRIVYGERTKAFKGFRDVIRIYTFEKRGRQTIVKTEIDFKTRSWFDTLMLPLSRAALKSQTLDGLQKLKNASEKKPV